MGRVIVGCEHRGEGGNADHDDQDDGSDGKESITKEPVNNAFFVKKGELFFHL
jgi:hypothetical protein